ncbi:MAG: hypothetical protein ACK4YU_02225 [Paracoccus sp. (in: a-proteobacteria)]
MTYSREPHPPALAPMPLRPPAGPVYPAFKRRIPERVFYALPSLMWLALSIRHRSLTLPSAANPALDAGGLWGESKSQGLALFGPTGQRFLPPFVTIDCLPGADWVHSALAAMADHDMAFPVVGKPDRGYQGWGVRLLNTPDDLTDYLSRQPDDAQVMLQALIDMPGEAGIFYIRHPGQPRGRIVSMAFVHPPHVIGDGHSTVAQLVARDPILQANAAIYRERNPGAWDQIPAPDAFHMLTNARSARLGAVYRDALDQVTPELEAVIDRISAEIPDFHFGRFDIRFRSIAELQQGRGFRIVELNGAGAEMLHIWAGEGRLWTAWRTLWRQYRDLFAIGAAMRKQGHRPVGVRGMIRLQRQQERLRRTYPPSS